MGNYRQSGRPALTLPAHARLPINRCNLPAVILGSLTFQRHPDRLEIDGVTALHRALFADLARTSARDERALRFMDYMRSAFLLEHPEEAGLAKRSGRPGRHRADYLRLLRGWLFDSDSAEAAVLKGWVESRFGLLARKHARALRAPDGADRWPFRSAYARAVYNTNALESQLDLLFAFCQSELARDHHPATRLRLYRGINRLNEYEVLETRDRHHCVLVLNNLSSFSGSRERADEFGDVVIAVDVPVCKLLYTPGLLPGQLQGEDEYLVLGGVYEIELT